MYSRLLPALLLCASLSVSAKKPAAQQIRHILLEQEAAWNRGDLRAFMHGYWENDSLLFVGKKGPVYGYAATLSNYLKSYPDTAHMGHFTSTVLQVKKLSKQYYMVLGKWDLKRSAGDVGGYYTLLFRRIRGEWVVVQDHSS